VGSAGVDVKTVGEPMTPEAVLALGELGIEVRHKARPLTSQLCREADVIYCMTTSQRAAVLKLAPELSERTFCLDPDADIPDPVGQPQEFYDGFLVRLRSLVRTRLTEQGVGG
ncbi:MAG TPA: low molecular weight protein arginine phosphatase, partial [Actinomycetota bacterium]|nr:low molecular weight protein arginine phosphatase [Actinomycetota bacterium]